MDKTELSIRFLEGAATAEEAAALDEWMADSPANARVLASHALDAAVLLSVFRQEANLKAQAEEESAISMQIMSDIVDDALESRRLSELRERANAELQLDQVRVAWEARREALEHAEAVPLGPRVITIPWIAVWMSIAAVIGLVVWFGQGFVARTPVPSQVAQGPIQEDVLPTQPGTPTQSAAPAQPVFVALVLRSAEAQWEGRVASHGDRLEENGLLALRSGAVEILFEDGAVVLIEGPATFQPTGPNAMRLVEGRLSAKVPPEAQGFEVLTPEMVLTDIGTEFGVQVGRRFGSIADVFVGRVVAENLEGRNAVDLTAGNAVAIDTHGAEIRAIPSNPSQYYHEIETYDRAPVARGQVQLLRSMPGDLSYQVFEGAQPFVMMERFDLAWQRDWVVDAGYAGGPAAGEAVDVYLVHFDIPTPSDSGLRAPASTCDFSVTFDRPVLGLIFEAQSLYNSDATLGRPGVVYPSADDPFASGRKLESTADHYSLSADGRTVRLHLRTSQRIDQLRIIVDAGD